MSPFRRLAPLAPFALWIAASASGACGADHEVKTSARARPPTPSGAGGVGGGGSTVSGACAGTGGAGGGGDDLIVPVGSDDPKTCAEAAANKAYVGCDFWPTPVANPVWSVFDFAAVVANAGTTKANVTVTQRGKTIASAEVAPNTLATLYLPWVPELKGPDGDECGGVVGLLPSMRSQGGAYHLVSTAPVTVYQFNALEYRGVGGPKDKDWSACPGKKKCASSGTAIGCFSFTNDASLLLPSTALTGNYRVTGQADWEMGGTAAYLAITGIRAATEVTVHLAKGATIVAGAGVAAVPMGGTAKLTLDAGDVVELVSDGKADLAGSLVQASAPVQVIAGMPCVYQPFDASMPACDHIEETVLPAETLGQHYFVTVPTAPRGEPVGHIVRIVGNVDGTTLAYPSGHQPANAPASIDAGQVIDLGIVIEDFELTADHELAVVTFMLGASIVDPGQTGGERGDPAQSNAIAVEQYRTKYVFLAPTDYEINYVDIVQPLDALLDLDGAIWCSPVRVIGSGYGVRRIALMAPESGTHVLVASKPVGIQVVGYGAYTSYQYPGGLDLKVIAAPPVPN